METIEVRYSPLSGGSYYHKYIVYTDSNGNQFAARGGPSAGGGMGASSTAESSSSSDSSQSSGSSSGSPFGNIKTEHGTYDPDFIDFDPNGTDPSETIIEGTDLSDYWQKIKDAMDAIGNEQHAYRPISQNSNTTVDEALRRSQPQNGVGPRQRFDSVRLEL